MKRRKVLTHAGGGGRLSTAFTMAEILLSLTIIGVVAAITLPSLTGNINERTWNTQRKALYARFSQAFSLIPSLNGYGSTDENAAETFITAGLAKVLKINNTCDSGNLKDCGLPEQVVTFGASKFSLPDNIQNFNSIMASEWASNTKAAAFETANGESILVYYNPQCQSSLMESGERYSINKKVCANFVYDLNGSKGPNTVGKDVGFITVLYPVDSVVVALYPYIQDLQTVTSDNHSKVCSAVDDSWRLPTKEDLISMYVNKFLIGNLVNERYWSSSISATISEAWYINVNNGMLSHIYSDQPSAIRCVKR